MHCLFLCFESAAAALKWAKIVYLHPAWWRGDTTTTTRVREILLCRELGLIWICIHLLFFFFLLFAVHHQHLPSCCAVRTLTSQQSVRERERERRKKINHVFAAVQFRRASVVTGVQKPPGGTGRRFPRQAAERGQPLRVGSGHLRPAGHSLPGWLL